MSYATKKISLDTIVTSALMLTTAATICLSVFASNAVTAQTQAAHETMDVIVITATRMPHITLDTIVITAKRLG